MKDRLIRHRSERNKSIFFFKKEHCSHIWRFYLTKNLGQYCYANDLNWSAPIFIGLEAFSRWQSMTIQEVKKFISKEDIYS